MKLYIPNELIDNILEYEGRLRYINGKFQINTDNKIYDCIIYSITYNSFICYIHYFQVECKSG